ncbi:ATP-binding protein [Jannaschia sp. R86511]|uniref:ATP-binding protein n=1 Tax=Jannaschia sp. R86511 TaxID=3093853 RepID=UPI0036D27CE5
MSAGCGTCHAPLAPAARFCSHCGAAVGDPPRGAERRRVSVVFADLSGFTALTEAHDPEDVRTAVEEFFALARDAVERWGGRIDQFAGDGVMAVFGDRVAHEDDAERAARAALAVRDAAPTVQVLRDGRPAPGAPVLSAHVGVATGTTVTAAVTAASGVTSPMGDAVNVAARLQADADDGQVLCCGTTARLLPAHVARTPLGQRRLRGRAGPVEVFALGGAAAASATAPARRSALVGRRHELADLRAAWRRLHDGDGGDAVLVVAEAGAGKTRLLEELRGLVVADRPDVQWWEGRTEALGATAAHAPLRQVVAAAAGVDDTADEEAVRRRLRLLVDDLDLGREDVLGPLQRLLAAPDAEEEAQDREGFRRRLPLALERLLLTAARRAPVVLCLQDLHRADPSTTQLLTALVPRLRRDVLVVANARPAPPAASGNGPGTVVLAGARTMALSDLDEHDVARLVASRLGGDVDPDLVRLVHARSGGNPFFAEEVLNRLLDQVGLVNGPQGWTRSDPRAGDGVPDTVEGVIAARLDLLPPDARRCLQQAAVLGREVTTADLLGLGTTVTAPDDAAAADGPPAPGPAPVETAVETVVQAVADLPGALAVLVAADLLQPAGPARFRFKHVLTQEVARSGLSRPRRRALHLAAARTLAARPGGRRAELAERLGQHYREAGEVEPAVVHLSEAAAGALDRYAVAEADALYAEAYRLLLADGDAARRVRLLGPLLVRWALVHYYRGSWHQATELLVRHDDDLRACPDPAVRGLSLAWRGFSAAIARSAVDEAVALLDEAVATGRATDDAELLATAATWRAWALFLAGRHAEAVADARTVRQVADRLTDPRFPLVKSAGARGLAHIGLGEVEQARQVADWLVDTGSRTGSTRATSMGLCVRSLAALVAGEADVAADTGAQAVAAATDPIYTDMARLMAVHGMVAAGRLEQAGAVHADMVASCTALRLDGLLLAVASADGVLRLQQGRLGEGMRLLEGAITRADADGSRFLACLARVYRAAVHARVATGAAAVPVRAVLRNPGFVARHALPARRRAATELTDLLATLPERGGAGLRGLVHIELVALLRQRGEAVRADELDRGDPLLPGRGTSTITGT